MILKFIITHIYLQIMKQSKTIAVEKEKLNSQSIINREYFKIGTICLKNALESIVKRLQIQTMSKIMINSAQYSQKIGGLKFLIFFENVLTKRKKQMAFQRLRQTKYIYLIKNKGALLLAFYYRRIVKNELKAVYYKLRSLKFQSKSLLKRTLTRKSAGSIPSPRMSSQSERSNLLAVSEDSISQNNNNQQEDDILNFKELLSQSQQMKRMELCHNFRELLYKLQRYDQSRTIQSMIDQLKDPALEELRRLQKMKIESKDANSRVYDSQLLLSCLANQMKLIIQRNVEQSFKNLQNIKQNKQILQLDPTSQKKSDIQYFSNEQKTTLNIITAVLKARQFKDIKRQIDFFAKKSNKKEIVVLLKQVANAFEDFSSIEQTSKSKDKNKQELNNTIGQLDKYLRTEKYDQVEKLKNKIKNSNHLYQLNALIETITSMYNELKKYKKKQFNQPERGFISASKHKNMQQQNEALKQQLKSLDFKFKELEVQNQRLKDAMKKNVERVHPSLLPKKIPQKQQFNKSEDMVKKYKQLEVSMQKRISSLSKQTSMKLQKAKQDSKKFEQKIRELQFQLENIKSLNKSMTLKAKQKDDFLFMYQNVTRKMSQKEAFVRDINEFMKKYSESKFIQVIERITNEQSSHNLLVLQLKNINTSFEDYSWKRKLNNMFLKTEGQIYANINVLIEKILSFLKQKQDIKAAQKDMENTKKNQQRLTVQNMNLRDQISSLRIQIKKYKEQIEKTTTQKSIMSQVSEPISKIKTPEKFNRTSVDKQVSQLKMENQKLKKELQQNPKSISLQQSTAKLDTIKKQLQEGSRMYQIIKARRLKSEPFIKEFNEFKRSNLKSIFVQIFQTISQEEIAKSLTINLLKNTITSFNDNTWKKKQATLLLIQQNELNIQINSLINLLIASAKSNEQSKYTALTTQIKNIKTMLSDNTWKRRQNALIIKDQSELHTAINQIIQFTITQINQKEELSNNKKECEQLRGMIHKYQTQITSLRHQKTKMKSQQKLRQQSAQKNQRKFQTQIKNQKNQNQQLRAKFEETLMKQTQIQSTVRELLIKTKQFQDFIQLFQTIKSKKMLGQTSINEVNQYKQNYANSSSLQIVDVIYMNLIQEYNKNSKDTPPRKNIQPASYQEKQKDLQIQKLREENNRLKSQFKMRPESPETKEKFTLQRQKTLTQMREISQLKLQIDKIKLENQQIKDELSNALKTNAQMNFELDRVNQQFSNTLKENKKKKQSQSKKSMQSLHAKSLQLQNLKREYQKQKNNYILELKQKQQKIGSLQKSLYDSQVSQVQLQEKMENYKTLYQKVQQQKNNFILLLQQKNEEFQITKENQELYLKQREQKENKILDLKKRFEEAQIKIKEQQKDIARLKDVLDQRDNHIVQTQKQYESQLSNSRNQLAIQNSKLNYSINSSMQMIQNGKTPLKKIYEDLQKVQLRKQLELVNQEMATFVRNSENQKRQMRQYMERLNNEMQMQNVLHNEEKKMLREDIERAKNQQYQINKEKLAMLRADIQGLRIENQRLTTIIDHNQESFHELINEHREMSIKIEQLEKFNQSLSEQNHQLTSDLYAEGQQKLELALKLQPLQDKLTELQNQISQALEQKKATQMQMLRSSQAKQNALQNTITKLTNQNRSLQTKISNQTKTILDLHQSTLRLQSQINIYRQKEREGCNNKQTGQYSNYLQGKLNQQSEEIQRLNINQSKFVYKIEQLIKNTNQLQKQRVQLLSQKRQLDYASIKQKNSISQCLPLQQKIFKLQQILVQKQKQISFLKRNSIVTINNNEQQLKVKQLQQQLRNYQIQSAKYKTLLQQKSKEIVQLQPKSQQNVKLNIQLKHLNLKYKTLAQDYSTLEFKYHQYQREILEIKKEKSLILQTHSSQNNMEHMKQNEAIRQEEMSWLRNQLIAKDQQIHSLRHSEINLINILNVTQQKLAEYQNMQSRYDVLFTESQEYERQIIDLKLQNKNLQNKLETSRDNERNAIQNQQSMRSQMEELIRLSQLLQRQKQQYLQTKQAKVNYIYVLREIMLQLDQQYRFQGRDQELELKLLQKISYQITQILIQNGKLKQKCVGIESNIYFKSWEEPKHDFMGLLQKLSFDLLKYLQHQQLINPQVLNINAKHLLFESPHNSEIYLQNLSNFIKHVISSINKDSLNLLMLYSDKLDLIKGSFNNYICSNNVDSFNQLKSMIESNLHF